MLAGVKANGNELEEKRYIRGSNTTYNVNEECAGFCAQILSKAVL